MTFIPARYSDLVDVFSKTNAEMRALHHPIDYAIDLQPGLEMQYVTAQEGAMILRMNIRIKIRKVWKESCYGKAETLEDAEEAARWW